MYKYEVLIFLLLVGVVCTSAQFLGGNRRQGNRGAQAQNLAQSKLSAGEQAQLQNQAELSKERRQQKRLEKKRNRALRNHEQRAARQQSQIAARKRLQAEHQKQAADFNNLNVGAKKDNTNKLSLQLHVVNENSESAFVNSNNGRKFAEGTRIAADQDLLAENQRQEELERNAQLQEADALSAETNDENQLLAQQGLQKDNQVFVNGFNNQQSGFGFNDGFGFDSFNKGFVFFRK